MWKTKRQPSSPSSSKAWEFESFDLTVSTVDSDGLSVSSCTSSLSSDDSATHIIETTPRKGVSFAQDEQGLLCHVKEIERVNNPDLWWNDAENRACLTDCLKVVEYYKGRPRLCQTVSNLFRLVWLEDQDDLAHPFDAILDFLHDQDPEVAGRGLEQHIVGNSKAYVKRHRAAVLAAVAEIKGTEHEDSAVGFNYIAECAASTSQDCKDLARSIALYDEGDVDADDLFLTC